MQLQSMFLGKSCGNIGIGSATSQKERCGAVSAKLYSFVYNPRGDPILVAHFDRAPLQHKHPPRNCEESLPVVSKFLDGATPSRVNGWAGERFRIDLLSCTAGRGKYLEDSTKDVECQARRDHFSDHDL